MQRGVPTITVISSAFITLANLEARALAAPNFVIAEIPHPLTGIPDAEFHQRVNAAWAKIEPWIKTHALTQA